MKLNVKDYFTSDLNKSCIYRDKDGLYILSSYNGIFDDVEGMLYYEILYFSNSLRFMANKAYKTSIELQNESTKERWCDKTNSFKP